jgi:hypothetical protein
MIGELGLDVVRAMEAENVVTPEGTPDLNKLHEVLSWREDEPRRQLEQRATYIAGWDHTRDELVAMHEGAIAAGRPELEIRTFARAIEIRDERDLIWARAD